ncbi:MAG: hypothetical protein ACFCUM_17355 [Bacteroidales bacterium]
MELPSSWISTTPQENNTKPSIQRDGINIYIMIRLTQLKDGGQLRVDIYESTENKKLNYKDFLAGMKQDNLRVIYDKSLNTNNLISHERKQILEGWDNGKPSYYHNTLWFIEGIERFYVFQWGSFNEKVHDDSLGFVKNLLNSFTEKTDK